MIERAKEIILYAFGSNMGMIEIASMFFVIKQLISVCAWLVKKFEGVLTDDE